MLAYNERQSLNITPKSRTLDEDDIWLSPTLIGTSLKSVFNRENLIIINYAFELLCFSLFLIVHTLIKEIQLFSFVKKVKDSLQLNEI